jgi:hypothetical protein
MCRAAHARWRGVEVAERHRNDAIVNRLYRIRALADLACGSIVDEQGAHQCAILENAIVHGKQGIVTVDDAVVAETLAESTEGAHAALAEAPVTPLVAAAYHLFAGVGDDEEGRFRAVKARFEQCLYEQFTKQATGNNPAILLVPDMKGFQILNALRQLAPRHVPRLAIPPVRAVRVQRLCVPWPRHD